MAHLSWTPPEATGAGARVILTAAQEVYVEGHRGLIGFDEKTVCVKTPAGTLYIEGEGLSVAFFSHDTLSARGTIRSVRYG